MRGTFLGIKLWTVMVLIALIIGILTRFSYSNNEQEYKDKIDDFRVSYDKSHKGESANDFKTLSQIEESVDAIVKVKAADTRICLQEGVLTDVKIEEIYKGKVLLPNQAIKVFEPSGINFGRKEVKIKDGYTLLNPDYEYILFLKKRNYPAGYKQKDRDKDNFIIISPIFGKFDTQKKYTGKAVDVWEEEYTYGDVRYWDIMAFNEEILEAYNRMKKEVLEKYLLKDSASH